MNRNKNVRIKKSALTPALPHRNDAVEQDLNHRWTQMQRHFMAGTTAAPISD
jgi:hypothetical protein